MDPIKKISFSRYKVLKRCGYMFYLEYIQRLQKLPGHPATLYGLTVHRTFEEWLDRKMPRGLDWVLDNVETYFKEQREATKIPLNDTEASTMLEEATVGAKNLYRILGEVNQLTPKTEPEVEVTFHSKGYLFNGRVDFMTLWDRNTVQITDAKGIKTDEFLDKTQIILYAYIVHKLFGVSNFVDCGYACFHHGMNTFIPVEIDLAEGEYLFNKMIQEYGEALTKQVFIPDPAYLNCLLCSVYPHCNHRTFISAKELAILGEDTILKVVEGASKNKRVKI